MDWIVGGKTTTVTKTTMPTADKQARRAIVNFLMNPIIFRL